MFVKFVNYPRKDGDRKVSEQVFECGSYDFRYSKENDSEGVISLHPTKNGRDFLSPFTFSLETTKVYVMSESGKTVDSYGWKKDDRGIIHRM